MSIYQPDYTDPLTGEKKKQAVWWYDFTFRTQRYRETTGTTSKTRARIAEQNRRREVENSFNGIDDKRDQRIRSIQQIADTYVGTYSLRHRAPTFAKYAVGHITRLLGKRMVSSIDAEAVIKYQNTRLEEKAAPKTINEETGFLLRMLEDQGDLIQAQMKRRKTLKLKTPPSNARAFTPDEKALMLAEAKNRKGSPSVYPALMLALHCGLSDKEARFYAGTISIG